MKRGLAVLACIFAKALALCENETDTNSEWLLYFNGASYLNLPTDNWSRYNGKMTTWSQLLLRREPAVGDTTILVDLVDQTLATGDAGSEAAWGIAADCSGSPSAGDMSINLTGTPFIYEAVYSTAAGFQAFGSVQCEDSQTCTASCGGICGFCGLGINGRTTTAELKVVDHCAFQLGIQAWATTTTVTSSTTLSITSTSTTYLGPTTTSLTSLSSTSTTLSSTATSTSITISMTSSSTVTSSTTTQVDGYYFYRFTPTNAETSGTCCCAHGLAELYFRNCGADVETSSAVVRNPGGAFALHLPQNAFDKEPSTKWRDTNRQPLVLEWQQLTLVDSYSYLTATGCPDNDPLSFELHGSQDGLYWELLDSRNLSEAPPVTWRPAQTEWFTFKNCTPTTTVSSMTMTSSTTTSSSVTSSVSTSSTSVSTTETMTTTESTTTSPEGAFILLMTYGSCATRRLYPILTQADCEDAARQLQLADTSVETTGQANRPEGCYFFQDEELWMGISPASKGKGAETSGPGVNQTRYPICSSVQSADRVSTSGVQGSCGVLLSALLWSML